MVLKEGVQSQTVMIRDDADEAEVFHFFSYENNEISSFTNNTAAPYYKVYRATKW